MNSTRSPHGHSLLFRTASAVAFSLLLLVTAGTGSPQHSGSPVSRLLDKLSAIFFGTGTRTHTSKQQSTRLYQPMMVDSSRDPTSPPLPPKP